MNHGVVFLEFIKRANAITKNSVAHIHVNVMLKRSTEHVD